MLRTNGIICGEDLRILSARLTLGNEGDIMWLMEKAIRNFHTQFAYEPVIENKVNFKPFTKHALVGMGGSRLAAALLQDIDPSLDFIIHNDYGLPRAPAGELEGRLTILSSYSGDTEEVLEAMEEGLRRELPLLAISTGGELLRLAAKHHIPYIRLPNTGIQPRSALGYSLNALLAAMGREEMLRETRTLATTLNPEEHEPVGKKLAEMFKGAVPVIYASRRNHAIAYNWKIKLNETGKTVAFCNVFPELNHNEMNSFDPTDTTRALSEKFFFLILQDEADHQKIQKRMHILADLYQKRGLRTKQLPLQGNTPLEKVFSSLLTADWTAFHLATHYGVEATEVPMVEEFKRLIR